MNLQELNELNEIDAKEVFSRCCSASNWVNDMVNARPYKDIDAVQARAVKVWRTMEKPDFMEAFDGHPKIGDPESLADKYRNTHALASDEQSSVEVASEEVIHKLAIANQQYKQKFGYIFIICATGKTADQMLDLINRRIYNDPESELAIAATEQQKITAIRISVIFS